jgi:hypothetical protein
MPSALNDRHEIKNHMAYGWLGQNYVKIVDSPYEKGRISNLKMPPLALRKWHRRESLASMPVPIGNV